MNRSKDQHERSLPVYYSGKRELKEELDEINNSHYLRDRLYVEGRKVELKVEEELFDMMMDNFFMEISHHK